MKKIIFGIFPTKVVSAIRMERNMTKVLKDNAIYEGLNQMFKTTIKTTRSSVTGLLESVGIPTQTALVYKSLKNSKLTSRKNKKTLVAAVVSLDMEEKTRQIFKRMKAHNVSTINCP